MFILLIRSSQTIKKKRTTKKQLNLILNEILIVRSIDQYRIFIGQLNKTKLKLLLIDIIILIIFLSFKIVSFKKLLICTSKLVYLFIILVL